MFTPNRDRLLETAVARAFLAGLLALEPVKRLLSSDPFSVDGTMIETWAELARGHFEHSSMGWPAEGLRKSFRPTDGSGDPPGPGRNGERNVRREKRSNATHASTTDPDARLYRKADGQEKRLCDLGHALMENRNGLVVDAALTHATGTAEREAALLMLDRRSRQHRITLGADKLFDVEGLRRDLRARQVSPPIAINGAVSKTGKVRETVLDGRTTRHAGDAISLRCRKRIEEVSGWIKAQAGLSKVTLRGPAKGEALFTFAAAAYTLVRLPKLLAGRVA